MVAPPCCIFTDGSAFLLDTPQFTWSAGAAIEVRNDGFTVLDARMVHILQRPPSTVSMVFQFPRTPAVGE